MLLEQTPSPVGLAITPPMHWIIHGLEGQPSRVSLGPSASTKRKAEPMAGGRHVNRSASIKIGSARRVSSIFRVSSARSVAFAMPNAPCSVVVTMGPWPCFRSPPWSTTAGSGLDFHPRTASRSRGRPDTGELLTPGRQSSAPPPKVLRASIERRLSAWRKTT
jgi:hypothetical protein